MQRSARVTGLSYLLAAFCMIGACSAIAADLQGRWVGYWYCGNRTTGTHFVLDIAGNSARFQVPIGIANLAGNVGDDSIDLNVEQWLGRAPAPQNTVTGITGNYLPAAGVMTGAVQTTGILQCRDSGARPARGASVATRPLGSAPTSAAQTAPRFIAVRTGAIPQPRENSNGLLFQVTDDVRSGRELSPAQCSRYADFLQAGRSRHSPIAFGTKLYSSVLDDELMLDVLGRDLNSWSDADFPRMRAISSACKRVMKTSPDPAHVQQAGSIRIWKPVPLSVERNRADGHRRWAVAIASLYASAIEPLSNIAMRIDEGLYDTGTEPATTVAAAADGLTGLWHGYYQCKSREFYMRLDLHAAAGQVEGTFEFSGGMETQGQRGVLRIRGSETGAEQFQLDPTGWVYQPRGATLFGLAGSRAGGQLTGRMTTNGEGCTTFSARRLTITPIPKNPAGLLFKVVKNNTSQLTPADCRRFGEWLATGELLSIGARGVNSLAFDQAAANAVLGKSASTWGEDDHRKFVTIGRFCAVQLRDSFDAADRRLHARVTDWDPKPFSSAKFNYTLNEWLIADQVDLVMTEAEELATSQLEEIGSLPDKPSSIDRLNEMLTFLGKREQRFRFMPVARRGEHRDRLLVERAALGTRVATTLAAAYADYPQTFDGFKALAVASIDQQKALRRQGVGSAAALLETFYAEEATRRGSALLPAMITEHRAILTEELANAGYGSMPVLLEIDQQRDSLADYWLPPRDSKMYADYVAYVSLRDDTARAMVTRSNDKLLEWVESLAPSQTANDRLDEFIIQTFRGTEIPSGYLALYGAFKEKRAAYNPDFYSRPETMMPLLRRQFGEVKYRGLETIAYLTTVLGSIRDHCPNVIGAITPYDARQLDLFVRKGGIDAVQRLASGQVESQAEANRAVMIGLEAMFGGAGCRVDMFGNTTACVSQEEADAAAEKLMYSFAGGTDAQRLMRLTYPNRVTTYDCGALTPQFMANLIEFAALGPFVHPPPAFRLPAAWEFVAGE